MDGSSSRKRKSVVLDSDVNRALIESTAMLHPRHPYRDNPPNWRDLAEEYPWFKKFVYTNRGGFSCIDWTDEASVLAVTKVLLKKTFLLNFDMPEGHLCPPVPQRLNYLLWVEDLIHEARTPVASCIQGIDIGTGASCIFPLLGTKHFGWKFTAIDIDPESVIAARRNVEMNGLQSCIQIEECKGEDFLASLESLSERRYSFLVTNPPFFDDLVKTGMNPHRACPATESELTYPGGEVGFVSMIMRESVKLRDQILWFTSMLGKKSSIKELRRIMQTEIRPRSWRTTILRQGQQARWAIAWSFCVLPTKQKRRVVKHSTSFKTGNARQVFSSLRSCIERQGLNIDSSDDALYRLQASNSQFTLQVQLFRLDSNTTVLRSLCVSGDTSVYQDVIELVFESLKQELK